MKLRSPRRIARSAVALVLFACASATSFTAAAAAEPDGSSSAITWAVQPSDGTTADGRPWVEQTLDPGESAEEHLVVSNFSDHEVTFALSAADGFFNDRGRFNILPSNTPSEGAGSWISIQDAVTVGPRGVVDVAFTTTVPQGTEPGDYAAGVAASVLSTSAAADGTSLGVESRVGFRVMTRVTGELTPSIGVESLSTSYRSSWNPFAPGTATVSFDVVNTGNARVRVVGTVEIGGVAVSYPADEDPQELLSGDRRRLEVEVPGVWPSVLALGAVEVSPQVIVVSGEAPDLPPIRTDVSVWAPPWPQLLVLLGVSLVVGGLLWRRRRVAKHVAALVEAARAEGHREALDATERESQ